VTAKPQRPPLELTLKPVCEAQSENVKSLAATMGVVGLSYRADEPLLIHPVETCWAPDNRYDGDAMKAVDEEGSLELYQKRR
jgi:hypothetical protein